jgi:hypothetical protein
MGGNSGIYYANRVITEDEEILETTVFSFLPEDIEGDQIPNVDDLILNSHDGCFYRVRDVAEDGSELTCERLTVAGSGGPSGPGGGTTPGVSIPVVNDTIKEERYFVTNQGAMNFQFYCTSQSTEGNKIDRIEYYIGTQTIASDDKGYEFNETITFDISPYVKLLSTAQKNTLAIKVIDIYGNESKRKNIYFYLVELNLSSTFNNIKDIVDETTINYYCVPTGGAGLNNRYIRVTLAPIDNQNQFVVNTTEEVKNTNREIPVLIDVNGICSHGVYVLKASFCALLPNGQEVSSAETYHQIIYYETAKNTPLIAAYTQSNKISQYDRISIKYMIVDKQATTTDAEVLLYTDNDFSTAVAKIGVENE